MALHGLDSLRQALDDIDRPVNNKLKVIVLQGFGNIAGGSALDTGRARSNWFLKIGSASNQTTAQTNSDPHLDKMPENILGKHLFYANNLPYINMLEYGGYPGDGPKTKQGYSDHAVGGWVRKELLIMRAAIRAI